MAAEKHTCLQQQKMDEHEADIKYERKTARQDQQHQQRVKDEVQQVREKQKIVQHKILPRLQKNNRY